MPVCFETFTLLLQTYQLTSREDNTYPGFLNVNSGSSSGMPSNLGIMDQIAALHWIQENIQDFGGDKV